MYHILGKNGFVYRAFDMDGWGMNKSELMEIETMFWYYGKNFHLSDEDIIACDKLAKERVNEALKQAEKPLESLTRLIAINRMSALMDKISEVNHIDPGDLGFSVSGSGYAFEIVVFYKGREADKLWEKK